MNEEVKNILDTVQVGALATVNRDRTPLVTPLHFARFEDTIIWVSDRKTRHSENVFRAGRAEFVVWDEQKRAVFVTAVGVGEVPEEMHDAAFAAYTKKLGSFMPKSEKTQLYVLPIGKLDENSTTQNMWHFVA